MKRIFKYPIAPGSTAWPTQLQLPRGARPLSVGVQDTVVLWALVDPEQPLQARAIRVLATGEEIERYVDLMQFVGTAVMHGVGGSLVWHVFVEPES